MRLICTIPEKEGINPQAFSYYLTNQGIENSCEEAKEGGKTVFRLWIVDEDLVEQALESYADYEKNPEDPRFKAHPHFTNPLQKKSFEQKANFSENSDQGPSRKGRFLTSSPYGPITILILLACILLFIFDHFHKDTPKNHQIKGVIQAPFFTKTEKKLLFDYPHYFELRDQLYKIYTPEAPSIESQNLINEIQNTNVWIGLYDILLNFRDRDALKGYTGPLFEKIRAGEIWRLITPVFMHLDFLHIFFNLFWLMILGHQIEFRLGKSRYLLLILITGIFANIAQYFVSGSFFLGLSGVIMGMAAFIWARQQRAPWEGYLLNRFTLVFLIVFVLGMFVLQLVLFFLQLAGTLTLTLGMANTAHITGAIVGYLLGCLPFFATRPSTRH